MTWSPPSVLSAETAKYRAGVGRVPTSIAVPPGVGDAPAHALGQRRARRPVVAADRDDGRSAQPVPATLAKARPSAAGKARASAPGRRGREHRTAGISTSGHSCESEFRSTLLPGHRWPVWVSVPALLHRRVERSPGARRRSTSSGDQRQAMTPGGRRGRAAYHGWQLVAGSRSSCTWT